MKAVRPDPDILKLREDVGRAAEYVVLIFSGVILAVGFVVALLGR
jgi:hypothetical protein